VATGRLPGVCRTRVCGRGSDGAPIGRLPSAGVLKRVVATGVLCSLVPQDRGALLRSTARGSGAGRQCCGRGVPWVLESGALAYPCALTTPSAAPPAPLMVLRVSLVSRLEIRTLGHSRIQGGDDAAKTAALTRSIFTPLSELNELCWTIHLPPLASDHQNDVITF